MEFHEEGAKPGMQGVFGLLLIVGGIVLVGLVLADLSGALQSSGVSNALGQYNPAGAAKVQPPGSSVGLPVNGQCPPGSVNLGGVCTVNPWDILSPGKLPSTAAPGSGQSRGTPGGCPKGFHSGISAGRYPVCVRD